MRKSFQITVLIATFFVFLGKSSSAVEVVGGELDRAPEEVHLWLGDSELKVYKDPILFLTTLSLIWEDPQLGMKTLMEESPLLATLSGDVCLYRFGEASAFKRFQYLSLLYEREDPRLGKLDKTKEAEPIVSVMVCGDASYNHHLGFVLESDLKRFSKKGQSDRVAPRDS